MKEKSILLLRPDKAGDSIKTLPVLRALKNELKNSKISIVTSKYNHSIFLYEKDITLYKMNDDFTLPPELNLKFDSIINLQCDYFEDIDSFFKTIKADQKYCVKNSKNSHLEKYGVNWVELNNGTPINQNETLNISKIISDACNLDLKAKIDSYSGIPEISEEDIKFS